MLTPTDSRRAPSSVRIGLVAGATSSWVGEESSAFSEGFIFFSSLMVVEVERRSEFRNVGGRRSLERTPGGGKRAGHAAVLNPWPTPRYFRQAACNKGKQKSVFTGRGAGCFLAGITGRGLDWWKRPPTHRSKRSSVPLTGIASPEPYCSLPPVAWSRPMGGAQSGVLNWSKVRLSGAFQPCAMTPDLGMAAVALVPGYSLELHLASLKRLSSFPRFPKSAVPHPQPLTPKKVGAWPSLGSPADWPLVDVKSREELTSKTQDATKNGSDSLQGLQLARLGVSGR